MAADDQAATAARVRRPPLLLAALPDLLVAGLALALWWLFRPGLLSPDSIEQYRQALLGPITDWHPPLMAIVLRGVLRGGLGLSALMLAQCVAMLLGVLALAAATLRAMAGDALAPAACRWAALAVLVLLLVPVSPLACYAMTFWKDAWAMVFLLWLGALLLRAGEPTAAATLVVIVLASALALVRHNAIVVLPVVGALLLARWRRRGWQAAVLAALAPLAFWGLGGAALDRLYEVRRSNVADVVRAVDLVDCCATHVDVCRALPWTSATVWHDQPLLAAYRRDDLLAYWAEMPSVLNAAQVDRGRLRAEYELAWRRHPLAMLDTKLRAFVRLLGLRHTWQFAQTTIAENPFGLAFAAGGEAFRSRLISSLAAVAAHPLWRWIAGVHAVWLLAALGWVAAGALAWARGRHAGLQALGGAMLLPLAYYASYLAAAPTEDHRFMMPATLFVQAVTLAAALAALARAPVLCSRRSRESTAVAGASTRPSTSVSIAR